RAGLAEGTYDLGVTESLGARQIAGAADWPVQWLSDSLGQVPVAFGLWKGDLTLKRRVEALLTRLQDDGVVAELLSKYGLDEPIEGVFDAGTAAEETEE